MSQLAISFADIRAAAEHLRGVAHTTPVHSSRTFDKLCGHRIFFKCENFQRAGAFKFRGAYNAISQLNEAERARGVIAFSSGNHGQAVALAARLLGAHATVCMPDDAPTVKLAATRDYGAEVITYPRRTSDREQFTRAIADERGLTLIPPYDHPHVMAGQGTVALELLDQVPELDTLVMPVGGGGLISGCALAARTRCPQLRVFGVETAGADDTRASLRCGQRVAIAPPTTIADGIRTTAPGLLTFPIVERYVEDVLVVADDDVLNALRLLLLRAKLVVEPTGAVGLAALLCRLLPPTCQRVGVIISGGNLDPTLLSELWV